MQGLNWDDLRFILAVDRQQSLAGAARQLGVNETTVARRLAGIEACLGAKLFHRTHGILQTTDAGRIAVTNAERVELEVQALEQAVTGTVGLAAGTVRLTSVPILVNRVLVPALKPLLMQHPQLRVELVAEPRSLSLTKREADIALRLARPDKELRAITRRVGILEYAVYADAHCSKETLPWLTYDDSLNNLPQQRWLARLLNQPGNSSAAVTINDAETLMQSIKAGLGKSLLPVLVGDQEPDLIRLDYDATACSRELWLMLHPDLQQLKRIRVVIDWLMATLNS